MKDTVMPVHNLCFWPHEKCKIFEKLQSEMFLLHLFITLFSKINILGFQKSLFRTNIDFRIYWVQKGFVCWDLYFLYSKFRHCVTLFFWKRLIEIVIKKYKYVFRLTILKICFLKSYFLGNLAIWIYLFFWKQILRKIKQTIFGCCFSNNTFFVWGQKQI